MAGRPNIRQPGTTGADPPSPESDRDASMALAVPVRSTDEPTRGPASGPKPAPTPATAPPRGTRRPETPVDGGARDIRTDSRGLA
jgi:hypothetical protein